MTAAIFNEDTCYYLYIIGEHIWLQSVSDEAIRSPISATLTYYEINIVTWYSASQPGNFQLQGESYICAVHSQYVLFTS